MTDGGCSPGSPSRSARYRTGPDRSASMTGCARSRCRTGRRWLQVPSARRSSRCSGPRSWPTSGARAVSGDPGGHRRRAVFVVAALVGGGSRRASGSSSARWGWHGWRAPFSARPPWHQGVLHPRGGALPPGRLRGARDPAAVARRWSLPRGAAPVGRGSSPSSSSRHRGDRPPERALRRAPADPDGTLGVAGVLGTAWTAGRVRGAALEPALVLAVYESLLVLVAALSCWPPGRPVVRQDRITDSMVGAGQLTGPRGLTSELRRAVGNPGPIHPWSERRPAFLWTRRPSGGARDGIRAGSEVADGDRPLAVVLHGGTALDIRPTAEAVRSAVRLTLTHQRLQEERRVRLGQLHEARTRLVAATDLERDQLREELHTVVLSAHRRPRGDMGRGQRDRRRDPAARRPWPRPSRSRSVSCRRRVRRSPR